jgi:lysophospholipase L1-like esterase
MRCLNVTALLLAAGTLACHRGAVGATSGESWVATWQGPPQLTEPRNMPPAPGLAGNSLRQLIHLSLGGSAIRFRVSNEFGDAPLRIESAQVARAAGRDRIDAATAQAIRFHGDSSITLAPGAFAFSDDVALSAPALNDVIVTLYMSQVPAALTGHPGSRTTSFILPGNHVRDVAFDGAVATEHWFVLSGAEVRVAAPSATVVVLGNSIADGRGSGTDKNNRWPDNLARRLRQNAPTSNVGVVNAGIGGNTVIRGGLGPTALTRFDRDVLGQRGARWVIVSEGVNDIGGARGADSSASIARQLIDAYQQMVTRAHARGMRVYGATILPFMGSQYGSPDHEAARQTVNEWIRTSGAFDGVVDLDLFIRDPSQPSRLRPDMDGGDHLHPNEWGYVAMAEAVNPSLFTP